MQQGTNSNVYENVIQTTVLMSHLVTQSIKIKTEDQQPQLLTEVNAEVPTSQVKQLIIKRIQIPAR